MRHVLAGVLLVGALGCEETLTLPGGCPELCPGGRPQLRDTVIVAATGSDSTFTGYAGWAEVLSLLAADDQGGVAARAWYQFPRRVDSLTVADSLRPYTVDSIALGVTLLARDTTVKNLRLRFHTVPLGYDTTATLEQLTADMTPATLIDSVAVADTLSSGAVRLVLKGDALDRLVIPAADSGKLAIGVSIGAARPTGVRLGSIRGGGPASFVTYARVNVPDTAQQRQAVSLTSEANGYAVTGVSGVDDADLLYVGRVPTARGLVRFNVPRRILDSTDIVRATLELTPFRPLTGLVGDPTLMEARAVTADIGAKSTPAFALRTATNLPATGTAPVAIDLIAIVLNWRGSSSLPQSLLLSMSPEGGSFHQPVFGSTRKGEAPRLRITYLVPAAVEKP